MQGFSTKNLFIYPYLESDVNMVALDK